MMNGKMFACAVSIVDCEKELIELEMKIESLKSMLTIKKKSLGFLRSRFEMLKKEIDEKKN